jgi:hypothetical protein
MTTTGGRLIGLKDLATLKPHGEQRLIHRKNHEGRVDNVLPSTQEEHYESRGLTILAVRKLYLEVQYVENCNWFV